MFLDYNPYIFLVLHHFGTFLDHIPYKFSTLPHLQMFPLYMLNKKSVHFHLDSDLFYIFYIPSAHIRLGMYLVHILDKQFVLILFEICQKEFRFLMVRTYLKLEFERIKLIRK